MSSYLTPRRGWLALVLLLVISLALVAARPAEVFPEVIPLPDGFRPEGIASGEGTSFYVGSIPTGAIYQGDFRTGLGSLLVQPMPGRQAIGLKYDPRTGYLFVSGGGTGYAYVYNGETGAPVEAIQLTTLPSFINDVVITKYAAYFTNSAQPELYRLPLNADGSLVYPLAVETIPLSGEFQFIPGAFNANGIAASPDGDTLIIVNSTVGVLYRVDPHTGQAWTIDLGGGSVARGDGILLQGKTLYVVQNIFNQVAVVELSPDFTSGVISKTISSPLFRVPTTIARFGSSLYVVNARFDTPPAPDTDYEVVRVPD